MNSLKKGFIIWILVSTIFVTCCMGKSVPVKRRMVLRLPFVHNQENSQNSFQQRTFLRMLNGNSKIKKALTPDAAAASDDIDGENQQHLFMFRRIY